MTRSGLVFTMLALSASAAMAAPLTPVNPLGGGDGRERCLVGELCPASGAYTRNASILEIIRVDIGPGTTLARVDDGLDALWENIFALGEVQGRARYAGDNSELGYDEAGTFVPLLSVLSSSRVWVDSDTTAASFAGQTHAGDIVAPATGGDWVPIPAAAGTPFPFVLNNATMGYRLASATGLGCPIYAANCGSPADWMVTWQVTSSPFPHYIIAWEDRDNVEGGPNFAFSARPNDWDYNDYVFELRQVAPVPEPALMVLLGMGLLGAATRFRRR